MVFKLEASKLHWRACCNTDCWAPPPEFLIQNWVGTGISYKFPGYAEAAGGGPTWSSTGTLSTIGTAFPRGCLRPLADYNRKPQTGRLLGSRNLVLTVLEAGKSIKALEDSVFGQDGFLAHR